MLKGILHEKLPPGSTVFILGALAGAFGREDCDEKWLNDNLADHDRRWSSGSASTQASARRARPTTPASSPTGTNWMRAFESIYAGNGATQTELDIYHLSREAVIQVIAGLPR